MVIVKKLVEWRLARENEVLGEKLPWRHLVHYKFHMTRPGFEPGPQPPPLISETNFRTDTEPQTKL
jgi:hypothetical protein